MTALEKINKLEIAAKEWFDKEKEALEESVDFVTAVLESRGFSSSARASVLESVNSLYVKSIDEYLGTPVSN